MKRKVLKAELAARLAAAESRDAAHRRYCTILRDGDKPFESFDVVSDEHYRETWSLFRPNLACGGIVLIEQRETATGRILAWQVLMATDAPSLDELDPAWRDGARRLLAAQERWLAEVAP